MTKYIFVTGGVVSGLGKGITAASLGRLLKMRGFKVAAQKLDPYINVDPGTMSPYQHGEVYVTEDGAETDLDLGHYERFIDEDLNRFSNITTGKVYSSVINKERKGEYLGKTVQIIPHITDEIKTFIYNVGKTSDADIVITEVGGTIGDIEGQPFIEAIRQVGNEVGPDNSLYVHVTLLPYLKASGEHKSKPTQHSVKELQGMGISPDIIVLRTDEPIEDKTIIPKIAHFCNVQENCVIENQTLPILYEAPLMLERSGISQAVIDKLKLECGDPDLGEWQNVIDKSEQAFCISMNLPCELLCVLLTGHPVFYQLRITRDSTERSFQFVAHICGKFLSHTGVFKNLCMLTANVRKNGREFPVGVRKISVIQTVCNRLDWAKNTFC